MYLTKILYVFIMLNVIYNVHSMDNDEFMKRINEINNRMNDSYDVVMEGLQNSQKELKERGYNTDEFEQYNKEFENNWQKRARHIGEKK